MDMPHCYSHPGFCFTKGIRMISSVRCRQVRRRASCRCLSLRPLLLERLGKTNDLLHDKHQLLRTFLQFIEQCHRLFLGKVYAQFLDDLVVVIAHGTVLCMKRREFGVIIKQCLIRFYHTERLREDTGLDENRSGIDTRLVDMERNLSHSSSSKRTMTQCVFLVSLECLPHLGLS